MGKPRGQRFLFERLIFSPTASKPRIFWAILRHQKMVFYRWGSWVGGKLGLFWPKFSSYFHFRKGHLFLARIAVFSFIFTLPFFNSPVNFPPKILPTVSSKKTVPPSKPPVSSIPNEKQIPKVEEKVASADASANWWLPTEKINTDLPAPNISAMSAIAIEVNSKKIIYEKNSHWRLPQASTTKITTALVALERMNPNETITVSDQALNIPPGSTVMGLSPGERHPLRDLLYGMMLPSGNDAAMAIATAVGGGDPARFVNWMNEKVTELGLNDTHYIDPHGVGGPNHYTSAYDIAVIAKTALDNPAFRETVNKTVVEIPANEDHKSYYLINLIKSLFDTYPGFIGVKPGYTDAAGYCLVGAATRGGHTVITVVLNSGNHFGETQELLDYSFQVLGV